MHGSVDEKKYPVYLDEWVTSGVDPNKNPDLAYLNMFYLMLAWLN